MRRAASALPLVVALALALLAATRARAAESQRDHEPAPDSVEELESPLESGFEEAERKPTLFPNLKRRLKDLPPFLRDSKAFLHLRTYVFNRRNLGDTRDAAWAAGGWLDYESGLWRETLSIGAKLFHSQDVYGPAETDGSLLLGPGQRPYTVLGEAFVKLEHRGNRLTLWRHSLELPYVNRQDSRMTPRTVEGVSFLQNEGALRFGAGHLTGMKERNDDDFVSPARRAGVATKNRNLSFVGLRWSPDDRFSLGFIDHYVPDVLNIFYAEADWNLDLGDELGVRLGLQLTDQRSVGEDLLTGEAFDTRTVGARAAFGWRSLILSLAATTTDGEEGIRSPFGSRPSYLSRMQEDFDRAGEDALGVTLSGRVAGLRDVSAFGSYTRGAGARDPVDGGSLPNRQEWDLTVDWRPEAGLLPGFWLRLRGSVVQQNGAPETNAQFRIILNYEIPVL